MAPHTCVDDEDDVPLTNGVHTPDAVPSLLAPTQTAPLTHASVQVNQGWTIEAPLTILCTLGGVQLGATTLTRVLAHHNTCSLHVSFV